VDGYFGLGVLLPEVGNILRLYPNMSRAEARPEDYPFVSLGGDIMTKVLVGDEEYLTGIQAFNDLDGISRGASY